MSMIDETNENNEEVQEAAKEFDIRSLGIEPMTESIENLVKVYNENQAVVKAYADSLKTGKTDPSSVDSIVKNNLKQAVTSETETVGKVRSFAESLGGSLFGAQYNLLSAEVMVQELENLLSLMRDERDYHLNNAIQTEKDKLGITSTPSEEASTATVACEALKGMIKLRCEMTTYDPKSGTIPANLFKTEGVRKGFNTDVLPRTPSISLTRSNVSSTHLSFRWQASGTEEATDLTETTLNDVAHNVISKGTYRVTGKDLATSLKKNGHGIGATDTEWELSFKTGTLYGKKA